MVQMLKSQSSQALEILGIKEIKQLNMVDFLIRHYGLDFSKGGISVSTPGSGQYCCLSPFKDERHPSFFVREVGGHWLFKDFSSGYGGSLIDFVLLKEGFGNVREALSHIEHLLRVEAGGCSEQLSFRLPSPSVSSVSSVSSISAPQTMPSVLSIPSVRKPYDVEEIYNKLRRNDVRRSRMLNAKIRQ